MNGVEILCHNLSHSDLVLSINDLEQTHPRGLIFARPCFSAYREIAGKIVKQLENVPPSDLQDHWYPVYSRTKEGFHGQYPVADEPNHGSLPVGFDLRNFPITVDRLSSLRFRGSDKSALLNAHNSRPGNNHNAVAPISTSISVNDNFSCVIESVFFPLMSVLLPKWLQNSDPHKRKIVFIVSGRGTPDSSSSRMVDNSTKFSGVLMTKFIEKEYPGIEVVHIHSPTNVFRYDENIAFVKRELLPIVDSIRDDLAVTLDAKWKDNLKLTISFADGSTARISAINAALKPYR
jgi:hypothetical protein